MNKEKLTHKKKAPPLKFETVYQPIINISSGQIVAYEGLTRINGESPVNLLRQAYQGGKIVSFDFKCLRSALKILPELKEDRLLFVNVEPIPMMQAFRKRQDGEELMRKIKDYTGRVVFELTEGVKQADFPLIQKSVHFIRSMGFRFALDDLADIGSKTFKFASLKPSFFKIDIGLISGIAYNQLNQEIVRQMVRLCLMNNSMIIAEGVEHKADLDFVKKMGIHYAQGFYFARPRKNLVTRLPQRKK